MRYLLLFLLIYASNARAQAPETNPAITPPAQTPPPAISPTITPADAHANLPAELVDCPACSPSERLIVNLNYYQQVLELLSGIDQQRSNIDPQLLRAVHQVLISNTPGLTRVLKPLPPPAAVAAQPKPAPRAARSPKRHTPKPAGIAGLTVGHVDEGNPEHGLAATIVLVSNGRPYSRGLGGTVPHNGRSYEIIKTIPVTDADSERRHSVQVRDRGNQKLYTVPWL